MQNHYKYRLITVIVIALLIVACTEKKSPAGAWVSYTDTEFGGDNMEFFKDQTCTIVQSPRKFLGVEIVGKTRLGCQWIELNDGRIKVNVGTETTALVYFAAIDGNRMFLDEGGQTTAWVRVKSKEANDLQIAIDAYNEGLPLFEKDKFVAAFPFYQKAAEFGHTTAQTNLGWMYARGHGTNKDSQAAVEWYRKSAEQGHKVGQSNLGLNYLYGCGGLRQSCAKAKEWLEKGTSGASTYGHASLAWLYATCKDSAYHDGAKAVKHALRGVAQKKGAYYSIAHLAAAYARQGDFDKAINNQQKAIKLLERDRGLARDRKEELIAAYRNRLLLFKKHEPYVDETPRQWCD